MCYTRMSIMPIRVLMLHIIIINRTWYISYSRHTKNDRNNVLSNVCNYVYEYVIYVLIQCTVNLIKPLIHLTFEDFIAILN